MMNEFITETPKGKNEQIHLKIKPQKNLFCLNGSIKNLQHLSVSQKLLCGERRFFRL